MDGFPRSYDTNDVVVVVADTMGGRCVASTLAWLLLPCRAADQWGMFFCVSATGKLLLLVSEYRCLSRFVLGSVLVVPTRERRSELKMFTAHFVSQKLERMQHISTLPYVLKKQ
jgi:hypothetical protein